MASPRYVTLTADTDLPVDLGYNYGAVEVTLIANAATTQFNIAGGPIASSTLTDGNHVLTTTLLSKIVEDKTTGNTIVHLRSSGTPTVSVAGL